MHSVALPSRQALSKHSPKFVPPMQQWALILMNSPIACIVLSVCCASSRVGESINTCGLQIGCSKK